MKNIQAQYQDLLEGKMSKSNFMRNVRMQFPQYISSVTSYDDSVKILKGKRILSENIAAVEETNMPVEFKVGDIVIAKAGPHKGVKHKVIAIRPDGKINIKPELLPGQKNLYGLGAAGASPEQLELVSKTEELNEAKKPEGVYGHNPNAETDEYRGIDHLNYYQVYRGLQYELAKMPEITDENYIKARKKVVDKIMKDPDAYKDLQLANFKAVKEMDEDLEMKEVKKDNLNDKPNEMKVVKKDVKGNTQDTLGNKEKKKAKNGKGLEHMTQTPKGKLEAFATPGKEKVMALKEHILDEMTNINPHHEDIGKGHRVKKKDDSKAGEVVEFDGHTATVKWDDGHVEDVQKNVLTKKDVPNPQSKPSENPFSKMPDLGKIGQDWLSKQLEEAPPIKQDPYGEDPNLDVYADKDIPGQGMTEDRASKIKALKEKLMKTVKEAIKKNPRTGEAVSTSTPADDALASKMGYTQTVPSTIRPIGKI